MIDFYLFIALLIFYHTSEFSISLYYNKVLTNRYFFFTSSQSTTRVG